MNETSLSSLNCLRSSPESETWNRLTGVLLVPIYMVFTLCESVFSIAIMIIWMLTWIGPSLWFLSRPRPRRSQFTAVAILSAISLVQSALGFLMILGKDV